MAQRSVLVHPKIHRRYCARKAHRTQTNRGRIEILYLHTYLYGGGGLFNEKGSVPNVTLVPNATFWDVCKGRHDKAVLNRPMAVLGYLASFSRGGLSLESRVVPHVNNGAMSVRSKSKIKALVSPPVVSGRSNWNICGTHITHNNKDKENAVSVYG